MFKKLLNLFKKSPKEIEVYEQFIQDGTIKIECGCGNRYDGESPVLEQNKRFPFLYLGMPIKIGKFSVVKNVNHDSLLCLNCFKKTKVYYPGA